MTSPDINFELARRARSAFRCAQRPAARGRVRCSSFSVSSPSALSASITWLPRTMCTARSKLTNLSVRASTAEPAVMSVASPPRFLRGELTLRLIRQAHQIARLRRS